ncbi:MAG TPA: S41 family peptidase [Erysipelotrichaceae bacterium]|nr:S41 family peptidase [Erysipelotrichia bacterium]HPX31968.1 S41 family peptidase [Erysipelotrichaceae bacterium]HQA84480.1 S41 family peptidase [Erysipelotrichaceae bacterium]
MRSFLKGLFKVLLIVLLCAVTFVGGLVLGSYSSKTALDRKFTTLQAVHGILLNDFYFGQNTDEYSQQLVDDAIYGMVKAQGDIHTEYMSANELAKFTGSLESSFVGIGVTYTVVDDQILVVSVIRSSPAEASGVLAGDIIIAVDGESVESIGIDNIADRIKGKVGTEVVVTVLRGIETIDIPIIRNTISNTVFSEVVDGIGVITLTSFSDGTGKEFKNHLDYLKENNVTRLIIDLRDNGGGYASTLNTISSYFLEKGDIVMREYDREGNEILDTATGGNKYYYDKIILLANGNTASSSEVFILAMKEYCNAIIVGEKTYGKGVAQVTKMLMDGSAIKYTDLIWKSSKGVYIGGTGIVPDYEVKLHDILYMNYLTIDEGVFYHYDTVSDKVAQMQLMLDFLGYGVDRVDGYFSQKTKEALISFQKDKGLEVNGVLDEVSSSALNSEVVRSWQLETEKYDTQMNFALNLIKQ